MSQFFTWIATGMRWIGNWSFLEIILVLCVLAIILGVVGTVHEAQIWETFKQEQHCRVVSSSTPTTTTGFDTSGNFVVMTTPGKTGWLCDDGVTYYR